MGKLKVLLGHIKRFTMRPVTLWVVIGLVIVITGIALNLREAEQRKQQKQTALAALAKQQKAQAAAQAEAAKTAEPHADTLFRDASDTPFQKPECKRLENRPGIIITDNTCRYRLNAHGTITMAVVFVHEHYPDVTDLRGPASSVNSLAYINTFLKAQAARYKVTNPAQIDMKFFGPYMVTEPVGQLYYRDNGYKLFEIYAQTSQANAVSEQNYDLVHYVLLGNTHGGVALPGSHRAFTYNDNFSTVPTFIHETLHLFGASDKYNNNDCDTIGQGDPFGRYNGTVAGKDIMCSNLQLGISNINDITAREIGWSN